jgi:hypothetical protein
MDDDNIYVSHTGEMVLDGFSAEQWEAIARERLERGETESADYAFDVADALRGLD